MTHLEVLITGGGNAGISTAAQLVLRFSNIYQAPFQCFCRTLRFMKTFLFKNKLLIIGIVLGSVAGFLYWKLVGCNSGSCMITSKWHNSTAYGAVMGGLFLSIFEKEKK